MHESRLIVAVSCAAWLLTGCTTAESTNPEEELGTAEQAVSGPTLPPAPPDSTCVLIQRGTLGLVDDADISAESPDYNASWYPFSWTGGSPLEHKSLYRFSLDSIPIGAEVTLAAFSVNRSWNDVHSTVRMRRATKSWDETNVTWNHMAGSFAPDVIATFDPYDVGFTTVDVTGLVQGWVSLLYPNRGLALEEDIDHLHTYMTSEVDTVSDRPSLYVCYKGGLDLPPAPPGSTCALIRRGTLGNCQDSDISAESPDFNASWYPFSWTGGSPLEHKSLYEFTLDPVPAGANVTLGLFTVKRSYNEVHSTVRVKRVAQAWDESNVTWNTTAGGVTNDLLGTFDPYGVDFTTVNITTLTHGWVSGQYGNHGIALEEDIENLHSYQTSEVDTVTDRPSLYVCWDDPESP